MSLAERALKLRQAMGYGAHGQSKEFATFLCVSKDRWSNVERGHPLSRTLADIVVRRCPGITRDWLYDGNLRGLSDEWKIRLYLPEKRNG